MGLSSAVVRGKSSGQNGMKENVASLISLINRWLARLGKPIFWPPEVIDAHESCGVEKRIQADLDISANRGIEIPR
jgi:hypothetical protein